MKTLLKLKKMKKKLIIGITASLFAVATVFNMGLLNFNKHSDATLEAIAIMAEASYEIVVGKICLLTPTFCGIEVDPWGNSHYRVGIPQ